MRTFGKLFILIYTAGSGAHASVDPCAWLLTVRPEFARRFDLSVSQIRSSTPNARYVAAAQALERLAKFATPARLEELGRLLPEAPVLTEDERAVVDQTPFFAAFPDRRSAAAAANFLVLGAHFDADLTPFEAGLFGAALGDMPRISRDEASLATNSDVQQRLIKSDLQTVDRRQIALRLMESARKSFEVVVQMATVRHRIAGMDGAIVVSLDDVRTCLAELRRGVVTDLSVSWVQALLMRSVALIGALEGYGSSEFSARGAAWWRTAIDRRAIELATDLGNERLAGTFVKFLKMGFLRDPAPIATEELDRRLTRSGRKLLANLAQATQTATPATAPKAAETKSVEIRDLFAPTSVARHKPKTTASTRAVPTAPAAPAPASASPSPHLTLFGQELAPDQVFETNQNGQSNVVYRIRFGPLVFRWMYKNETLGRKLVGLLDAGGLDNPLRLKRPGGSRYDGPVFALKPDRRFYAVIVKVDDEWQVIDVVHNDQLERTLKSVVPL